MQCVKNATTENKHDCIVVMFHGLKGLITSALHIVVSLSPFSS